MSRGRWFAIVAGVLLAAHWLSGERPQAELQTQTRSEDQTVAPVPGHPTRSIASTPKGIKPSQESSPGRSVTRISSAVAATLDLGPSEGVGKRWKVVHNAVAVPEGGNIIPSDGKVIASQAGFWILRTEGSDEKKQPGEKRVLYDPGRKQFGVVSGTLIVGIADLTEAARVASDYELEVLHVQDSILTVFFASNLVDPSSKLIEMRKDSRVPKAEMEVLVDRMMAQ